MPAAFEGQVVTGVSRLGKRILVGVGGDLHIVIHLMIAGRLRWVALGTPPPGKLGLAGLLADLALSRLLRDDWPRSLDEL